MAETINIIVGLGIIGAVWRLTSQVAALRATMDIYARGYYDHEDRLRSLEARDAA